MFLDKKKMAIITIIAIFFVALDRFLKFLALSQDQEYRLLGDVLKFNFTPNPNIAFSLPLNGPFLNILIGVLVIGLVWFFHSLVKQKELAEASTVIFVLLGAISNLADRLVFGYVIDYLDLIYFTVFNIADAMIVCGVFVLVILSLKVKKAS